MADSMAIPAVTVVTMSSVTTPVRSGSAAPSSAGPAMDVLGATGDANYSLDNPQVAQQVEEYLRSTGHDMKFSVDDETGQTIVRIYNSATGDLVRQIPGEDMVRLARALKEGEKQTLQITV